MAVTIVGAGSPVVSNVAITPGYHASSLPGHIGVCIVETGNQAVTTPTGWTVATPAQGSGTTGATGTGTMASLFVKRLQSGEVAPTIADTGDHQMAQIVTIDDGGTVSDPVNFLAAGSVLTVASTSVSIPGLDTTSLGDNCLVMAFATFSTDTLTTQFGQTWTNASLSSFTFPQLDYATDTNSGGGFGMASGYKDVAGVVSATTTTMLSSSLQGKVVIAIAPQVPALTAVGRSVAFPFDRVAQVTRSLAVVYDRVAQVTRSLSAVYDTRNLAARSIALAYDRRQLAARSVAFAFDRVAQVTRSAAFPYDRNQLTTRSVALAYDVRALVTRSLAVVYDRAQLATRSLAVVYDARQLAARSVAFPFDRVAQVTRSAAFPYDRNQLATRSLALVYDRSGQVGRSVAIVYDRGGIVGRSAAVVYDTASIAGRSVVVTYDTRAMAGRSLTMVYDRDTPSSGGGVGDKLQLVGPFGGVFQPTISGVGYRKGRQR